VVDGRRASTTWFRCVTLLDVDVHAVRTPLKSARWGGTSVPRTPLHHLHARGGARSRENLRPLARSRSTPRCQAHRRGRHVPWRSCPL